MSGQKIMCGVCDTVYDPSNPREEEVHEHWEPQSGHLRRAWLASQLPWYVFEIKMRDYLYRIDDRRLEIHERLYAQALSGETA